MNTIAQSPATVRSRRPAGRRAARLLSLLGGVVLAGLALAPTSAPAGGSHESVGDLTRQLLTKHGEWQRGDASARAEGLKVMVGLAEARLERLAEMMADHPDVVLRDALPAATRSSLPSAVQDFIETEESIDGDLEILHEDGHAGSRYRYYLQSASDRLELYFARSAPELETGDRVRVKGVKVKQALALDSGQTSVTVLATALPNTFGAQKTLVILVNFQDKPTQTWLTPAQAKAVVFGPGATAVTNFYLESSYQQTWLTGDAVGVFTIPVSTATCDTNSIATQARAAAQAAGANPGSYNRFVYAFPQVDACGWWGLGTVGGNPSQAWINGSFQNGVVSHEMGHNFGLYHSHGLDCGTQIIGSNCTSIEYGDTLDTMGSAVPPKHYNAAQKERLGWLNFGASPPITTVQSDGVYTIDPYETVGTAPKALKVKTPGGDWYYVEYRQALGFDASTVQNNANVKNGVVVHLWQQQGPNSIYLLDMTPSASWADPALTVNNTFTDSGAGISITTVWTDTTAGVNVSVDGGPACVRNNPTVSIQPASQQGAAGASLTYSVSVTNKDVACPTATFGASATLPAGWTATFTPPTLNIAPGVTGAMAMKVTSTMGATGSNPLSAVVSNTADSTFTASAGATYQVQASGGSGATGSFTDNFNRPDAATLGNGWTQVSGTMSIQSNEAVTGAARATHMAVQGGLSGAIQTTSARFASNNNTAAPRFALLVRYQDPKNYYMCYRQTGTGALGISRVANGVETVLKSVSVGNPVKSQFFTLGCQAQGGTVTLSLNGASRVTANNAATKAGKVGMAVGYPLAGKKGSAAHDIDDFSATVQ